MRLTATVQQWLDSNGWEDPIEVNQEEQTSQLNFTYQIQEQSFNVWIETNEKRSSISIYLYAPFKVLPNKIDDFCKLQNEINISILCGSLVTFPKGNIRYQYTTRFINAEPSIEIIDNMLEAGYHSFNEHWDDISTVALTKTSYQTIVDQRDS
jgi:hypothetical protein